MGAKVQLEGLEAFRRALRELPEDLAKESVAIVRGSGEKAKSEVQQAYPEGSTGNLRRGVTRQEEHGRFGAKVTLRSRAQHSWLFENGSKERRTRTGAYRGSMPEAAESQKMIPIVIRQRKQMVEALKDLVRRAGFRVD